MKNSPSAKKPQAEKLKLLVSYGGAFNKRASSGGLHYSGESRLIAVDRRSCYSISVILRRLSDLRVPLPSYFALYYRFKSGDLSPISSDNDLRNMIDERDSLAFRSLPHRPRLYICSVSTDGMENHYLGFPVCFFQESSSGEIGYSVPGVLSKENLDVGNADPWSESKNNHKNRVGFHFISSPLVRSVRNSNSGEISKENVDGKAIDVWNKTNSRVLTLKIVTRNSRPSSISQMKGRNNRGGSSSDASLSCTVSHDHDQVCSIGVKDNVRKAHDGTNCMEVQQKKNYTKAYDRKNYIKKCYPGLRPRVNISKFGLWKAHQAPLAKPLDEGWWLKGLKEQEVQLTEGRTLLDCPGMQGDFPDMLSGVQNSDRNGLEHPSPHLNAGNASIEPSCQVKMQPDLSLHKNNPFIDFQSYVQDEASNVFGMENERSSIRPVSVEQAKLESSDTTLIPPSDETPLIDLEETCTTEMGNTKLVSSTISSQFGNICGRLGELPYDGSDIDSCMIETPLDQPMDKLSISPTSALCPSIKTLQSTSSSTLRNTNDFPRNRLRVQPNEGGSMVKSPSMDWLAIRDLSQRTVDDFNGEAATLQEASSSGLLQVFAQPPNLMDAEIPLYKDKQLEFNLINHATSLIPILNEDKVSLGESRKNNSMGDGKLRSDLETIYYQFTSLKLQTIRNCDLEEIRELGSGTHGTVFHGKWRGSDVAIKRLKPCCFASNDLEEKMIAEFCKEAHLLSQLHHPNVVAFYGVVMDGPLTNLATVTEYMVNGSLKSVLQRKDRTIDRRKRLMIAMNAAFGMEYLHEKNIVHFDLKSDNFLINMRDPSRLVCKIGDLGLSKVKQRTFVSGSVRGTVPWMAPELLTSTSGKVSEKVDVYSFGIVMWELLTGEEPYKDMRTEEIVVGILKGNLRPEIPTWCDPAWRLLMERCWSSDPTARPAFSEIARELRAIAASVNIG